MFIPITIPREFMQFLHYTAITGFLIVSTLVINLNHKAFNYVMKDNAKKYWWLFVILAIIPLALFLYAFTFIFGKLFG
jgi:apolipoprotein N-acyltransferase